VIADAATVPAMPATSHFLLAILGIPLGILVSICAAFVADYFDPSFRSADEVWDVLQLQVLAALPGEDSSRSRPPILIEG
jgi:capsular polysaccharide biosynthesis protein